MEEPTTGRRFLFQIELLETAGTAIKNDEENEQEHKKSGRELQEPTKASAGSPSRLWLFYEEHVHTHTQNNVDRCGTANEEQGRGETEKGASKSPSERPFQLD